MLEAVTPAETELKDKDSPSRLERELHRRRLVDAVVRRGNALCLGVQRLQVENGDGPSRGRGARAASWRLCAAVSFHSARSLRGVGKVERGERRHAPGELVRSVKEAVQGRRVGRLQEGLREGDNLLLCLCS